MRQARFQRDEAIRESRRADAQVEFQNLLMSEVGDEPITMRQVLDTGRVLLERHSAGDPRFQTTMLLQLSNSYAELAETKIRGALLARAESLALAGRDAEQLPEIRCYMADNFRMEGRYEEALANARRNRLAAAACKGSGESRGVSQRSLSLSE